MKNLRNKVQLIGHLGADPEIKLFDKKRRAKFALATHETYRDANGEKVTTTQWHQIVAWGKTTDLIAQHAKKGTEILIEGKLTNRNYEDKDGNKKYITEIVASNLLFIGKV